VQPIRCGVNTKLPIRSWVNEMGFGTTNIERVWAQVFPAGQLQQEEVVAWPGMVLVGWESYETEKYFQVYVDGRLSGVTEHPGQRMQLLEYEHSHPAGLEVIWVTKEDRYTDFAKQLSGFAETDGSHAVIYVPRMSGLSLAGRLELYWDGGSGVIDYSEAIVTQPVWANPFDKWGFGLDTFGEGDFGYSSAGAVGWGLGSFGIGEFGFDADELILSTEALEVGEYQFAVRLVDEFGNWDEGQTELFTIGIDPVPEQPELCIASYDEVNDELVLEIGFNEKVVSD